jgi:hypothetical protein
MTYETYQIIIWACVAAFAVLGVAAIISGVIDLMRWKAPLEREDRPQHPRRRRL